MDNFIYDIPTKLYFGRGQIAHLPELVKAKGRRVLLVYGGGSIKKIGIYDTILELLSDCQIVELPGVEPNPRIESVRQGAALCKEHNIDVILAVGGGSTIDCSKVIAAAACYEGDAWDLVLDPSKISQALPLIDVLTLSATGTEMNTGAVITNFETDDKKGTGAYVLYPYASICDPTYTFTVSAYQTAAGTADIMSHTFENYFQHQEAFIQERLSEAILSCCIRYLPVALANPDDYEARANLMWASTMALNGLTSKGRAGAWTCHAIEHLLSAYYDITHAVGLAILTPRWMAYVLNDQTVDRFAHYARTVWLVPEQADKYQMAKAGIEATYQFFEDLAHLPMTLPEVGIDDAKFDVISERVAPRLTASYVPLAAKDVRAILEDCLTPGVTYRS
ncbi:iron-containing alcohol dehydrogenase [uncultured Abiotrophia sp.]|uniref:iron-containing alcohol dehydrogenase n=1 Tax=uncultured Abiotrophia sp. TaxID=316094 RepID=UPI0028DBB874|nr:iron-containing alcohol dehydrogenase [uncultured Abiotrophia sp.]